MTHGKVLDKQTLDFAARVLQNLPDISGEEMQYLISNPAELKKRLLALKKESATVGFTETALLRPVATIVASGKDDLDEDAFFQTRKGEIWVSESFRETFGSTFRKSRVSSRSYVACELKQNAYDTDIRKDLPKPHLSKLGEIARLIKAQRGGMSGILLTNGRANIFYVKAKNGEVFAVDVIWYAGDREWNVGDWRLDEDGDWGAGNRVLFPGNAEL